MIIRSYQTHTHTNFAALRPSGKNNRTTPPSYDDKVSLTTRAPKKHLATGAFATLGVATAIALTGVFTESVPALYIAGGITGGVLATALITRASEELHSL